MIYVFDVVLVFLYEEKFDEYLDEFNVFLCYSMCLCYMRKKKKCFKWYNEEEKKI